MKRPNFKPIFEKNEEFCEKVDKSPVVTYIPNQAISLSELVRRFESGQRLNVHSNYHMEDEFTRDKIYEETFDDAAPDDIHDIVDVEAYYLEHQAHKSEFNSRMKKKKESPQEAPKEAPKQDDAQ